LVSVEVNDNWRDWDDDMAVGSVHLIETLEFLHALRQIDWQGPLLLDQFPFREDPIEAAHSSIRTIRALDRLLDRIDLNSLAAARDRQDALEAQHIVMDMLVGTPVTEAAR
jgi:xylose isomerase